MSDEPKPSDYVEMRFGPRWTYISCVRKFVTSFFMIGLADKARAEQISLAASELLENAVKYSSEDEAFLRVSIAKSPAEVDVCVSNAVEPHQLNILRREFALATAGDPGKTYLQRMQQAAETEGTNRLGLARIRYEAGARLHLETTETSVSVHAIFATEAV
jgi:hypothetical protein